MIGWRLKFKVELLGLEYYEHSRRQLKSVSVAQLLYKLVFYTPNTGTAWRKKI